MEEATQQQQQQQPTTQPPEPTVRPVPQEAQRRRPPIRASCDCCGSAQDKL